MQMEGPVRPGAPHSMGCPRVLTGVHRRGARGSDGREELYSIQIGPAGHWYICHPVSYFLEAVEDGDQGHRRKASVGRAEVSAPDGQSGSEGT